MDNNLVMNPMRCPKCKEYGYLRFEEKHVVEEIAFIIELPYYYCYECSFKFKHERTKDLIEEFSVLAKEKGIQVRFTLPRKKYPKFDFGYGNEFTFIYDSRDYLFIPGLLLPWNDGALTPVFFDLSILNYYINDPDYSVSQLSFSRISIYKNGQSLLSHGFGINRNRILFTWLKDLHDAFSDGKKKDDFMRFLSSNVESDHDVASDFYRGQIELEFTESDNETRIFDEKNNFEKIVETAYGFELAKLDVTDLHEKFRTPIENDKFQIFPAYLALNKLLVENINKSNLKSILVEQGISQEELKGLGSLKLLEIFISSVLNFSDGGEIICPLFVLYDLRKLDGHLHSDTTFNEEYEKCKLRLTQLLDVKDIDFYKIVIDSLIMMYVELNKRIAE